jgi:hemoglobin
MMSEPQISPPRYGEGDASFQAAGGEAGIRCLVDRFFDLMGERPDAAGILKMHPRDLEGSRDKLARFLCGWLGGPKRYAEKYGPIKIPKAHVRFPIGRVEAEAWLDCMAAALADQPMAEDFKIYLLRELRVPADRILRAVLTRQEAEGASVPSGDSD